MTIEAHARELLAAEYRKRDIPGPFVDLAVPSERDVAALVAITKALGIYTLATCTQKWV